MITVERRLGDRIRELDDLVLVRSLREGSGADDGEILMCSAEIDRVRSQLARLARMAAA